MGGSLDSLKRLKSDLKIVQSQTRLSTSSHIKALLAIKLLQLITVPHMSMI